jgi:hypothetical protein
MRTVVIIIVVGLLLALGYILYMGYPSEHYGQNMTDCDERCFSSQYYDACIHACVEGTGDWTGRGNEFAVDSIAAPIPLEDENADDDEYVSTYAGPWRYETPGH